MAQMQVIENATQRGGNHAAQLDAVGGAYEVLAYQVLSVNGLGEIDPSLFESEHAFEQTRKSLVSDRGLGYRILHAFLGGCIPEDTIKIALRNLKDGGQDVAIMQRVRKRIDRETVEREAEQRRLAEETERRRLAAEKAV